MGQSQFFSYEDSLVSSNLNSKLLRFHSLRPNLHTKKQECSFRKDFTPWEGHYLKKNSLGLPSTMRLHANCRLHPAARRLMQVVSCGSPKGLFFEGCYGSPDRVQCRLLDAEHHLGAVVAAPEWLKVDGFLFYISSKSWMRKVSTRYGLKVN